ncbi:MAG TPA: AAA family ATPase [Longimicrobiales bacterium]|nr:AAA family ATPase [Longimicrobiales bacterium]
MPNTDPLQDLALLVQARWGVIVLRTAEEERARSLLLHLADRLHEPYFEWSRTKGLRRQDQDTPQYNTTDPGRALSHVEAAAFPAIYHFRGLGPFLGDATVQAALLEAGQAYTKNDGCVILTGADVTLPDSLGSVATSLELAPPSDQDYRDLLAHILRDVGDRRQVDVELTPDQLNQLYASMRGLTLMEAQKILTKAIIEDGKLGVKDLHAAIDAKKQVVEREGLLEYYPAEESMTDIADLKGLKDWLGKRKQIIAQPEKAERFGLEFPKGVLLVGVPGCGKSLSAKAVATEWNLPLLKLDPGTLYNKYIGESEKNFKRAVQTAERMSPVVLWIDELEKAFAQGGTEDGGVSQRILGGFLSWLQDRKGDVFVVATANQVEKLPPEFLRKGRFDEIFFVDLPDAETRKRIFEIHLKKRSQDPSAFDLTALAAAADGFAGSEIEQVVISGLYTAFSGSGKLDTETLLKEIRGTSPLSSMMREKIDALRAWSRDRTVSAQ